MKRKSLSASVFAVAIGVVNFGSVGLGQVWGSDFSQYLGNNEFEPDVGTRHFRLGALVGLNFKAQFSMNGTFKFSQNNPGPAGSGGIDRTYDDGYVRVDASGNYGDQTWNWGYQNTNQIVGNSLVFHAADTYTASGRSEEDADAQVGFELAYGGHLARAGSTLVGWEFGFGFLPINIEDNRTITGVSATRTVHAFDISGVVMPNAPYTGTATGPGPLISDQAQGQASENFNNLSLTGTRTLDVTLYNFRLGPTLHWEVAPRLAVALSGGAALGVVSGDLEFNESVLINGARAVNVGSHGSTELIYGGYVSAALMFHAVEHGDFYLGVQYMPMSDATFSGAGREAQLDMSGAVFVSVGINWPF